ncbi:MAG: NAD(P)-dependent oxidoreductase [Actinomycetota bacterium]|nr:NAD(P)-dependent oxidoreductase [Actinomycetota bacterium]
MREGGEKTEVEAKRPAVGLACSEDIRARYIDPSDLVRLESFAEFHYQQFEARTTLREAQRDEHAEHVLAEFCEGIDALVVCHGAPYLSERVLVKAPRLRFVGELEGDRFSYRIDLQAALDRDVVVVDTTHGSSWPTAEWALALMMIGLRNAGALFRRLIAGIEPYPMGRAMRHLDRGYSQAELSGKRVGLLGFGHVAWRLVELLRPFNVDVVAYDPYAARDLAVAYGIAFAPLETVLDADVVVCLLPLTPSTEQLIGFRELDLLRPESVFVNVSRGRVVDSAALARRLERNDIVACLDVFDPEPFPLDSPLLHQENVFVTPHIAGVTAESRTRFFSLMVDELARHFGGCEPQNLLTARIAHLRNSGTDIV